MKTRFASPWSPALLVTTLALFTCAPSARPADSPPPPPQGVVEFAGRIARDHWYLFGPEKRAGLEALNRELREALQQEQGPSDDATRRAAASRAIVAAGRLLEQVKACPRLLRVDLTAAHPVVAPSGPVELPGDTGALLFEVVGGGDSVQYSAGRGDFAQPQSMWTAEASLVILNVAAGGTTYAVAGLEHVPFGRTTVTLEFRQPGRPSVRVDLDVRVPAPGRLKLTVLSDDTDQPTPAMVRLMWRTDGLPRQPANGIEFAQQFDKQGYTSGARTATLPGPFNEQFWCVPGPFEMALAPGVWQIGVRRGIEHEVIFEDVTIRSGETVAKTFRPPRWVDMRQRGWWSGDDHVHCRILSDEDAHHLMAWVQAEDVHLANAVKMGDISRTYFEQRGFGPDFRVVEGEYVLAPGQECPRTSLIGHTLAMNITSMVRDTDRYFLYDEVFDAVHAQGGLTGYAHIMAPKWHFEVQRDMSLNVPRQKVDFAEILQFNHLGTDLYYQFLNLGFKLTASAGSDVPWGGTIGEVRVYADLEKKPFSADAWFESFRRGHTFTSSGPMIEFQVDDALPGDEIRLDADRPLRVHARAWGDPDRMTSVKLEIVRHGEVLRAAESTDPKRPEAELDFTVQAGYGCWIAARARAGDGTSAHTTPVYVVREGLRFWKFDELKEQVEARLASLGQIEQIIADARRLNAQGSLETDRDRKQLALQSDALLERVVLARKLYEDLERIAEAERGPRGLPARMHRIGEDE